MSRYDTFKQVMLEAKPCPDGVYMRTCASCLARDLSSVESMRCWYCKRHRITRELTLNFDTHTLVHLVCDQCANALDKEKCTFSKSEHLI